MTNPICGLPRRIGLSNILGTGHPTNMACMETCKTSARTSEAVVLLIRTTAGSQKPLRAAYPSKLEQFANSTS
jgi:hypothetical protein